MQEPRRRDHQQQNTQPGQARVKDIPQGQPNGGSTRQRNQRRSSARDEHRRSEQEVRNHLRVDANAQAQLVGVGEVDREQLARRVPQAVVQEFRRQNRVGGLVGKEIDREVLDPDQTGDGEDGQGEKEEALVEGRLARSRAGPARRGGGAGAPSKQSPRSLAHPAAPDPKPCADRSRGDGQHGHEERVVHANVIPENRRVSESRLGAPSNRVSDPTEISGERHKRARQRTVSYPRPDDFDEQVRIL